MLRMVDAINQEYIAKMGRTAPIRVESVILSPPAEHPENRERTSRRNDR